MKTKAIISFVVLYALVLIVEFFMKYKNNMKVDFRKIQTANILQNNKLTKKLENYTRENVKYDKVYDTETLCMQAGYYISYPEFLTLRVVIGIGLGLIVGFGINNPFMGLLFTFLGSLVPEAFMQNIRNRRLKQMEEQIGPMMHMITKRYRNNDDFAESLVLTRQEYEGIEPMASELDITIAEINAAIPIDEALKNLARRTGNKYIDLFADYFQIAYQLGTDDSKDLLYQAYIQFDEDRKMKLNLQQEIDGPVRDAYIMIGAVPVFGVFSAFAIPDFLDVISNQLIGKVVLTVVTIVLIAAVWAINKFIAAPLE